MIGASTYGFLWTTPLQGALDELADAGFDSVELLASPPHLPVDAPEELRRTVRRTLAGRGLDLVSLNTPTLDVNLAALEDSLRAAAVAHYRALIALAADLGAPLVVVSPGKVHPLQHPPIDRVRDLSLASLDALAKEGERANVTVALENLPYGLFETADDLSDAIGRIGSAAVRIAFDFANAHGREDPIHAIRTHAREIALLQISDTSRARWAHDELGEGELDLAAVVGALGAHPDIPAVLEVTTPGGAAPQARSKALLERLMTAVSR